MFLSIIIPSPNSLGRNMDVFLWLLIDELNHCGHLRLWCMMSQAKKSDEKSFDVHYQWFSCVWDGF